MIIKTTFIKNCVKNALCEDIGKEDITTNFLVSSKSMSRAHIIVKEEAIICGLSLVKAVFRLLDPDIKIKFFYNDGSSVKKNTKIATLKGKTRALLTGERVALNFLGYLSGISTYTNDFVKKTSSYKTKILDTRKTTPGLRKLEKYAVKCGGGANHRFGLNDMALIKDNHRAVCHPAISIKESIALIRKKTKKLIEIEVDTLEQFKQALDAKPDMILLDNMITQQIKKAVEITKDLKTKKKPLLEASGGINLSNVTSVAKTGVDRISIGSLTHSPKAVDILMEVI